MQLHKKVVVVDDDQKVVMLLEKILLKMGCKVFKARGGTGAWDLVQREKPDLLVADMYIPGIMGMELAQKVKSTAILSHCKVLLISSVFKEDVISGDIHKAADGFIKKPIDVKAFVTEVVNLVSRTR